MNVRTKIVTVGIGLMVAASLALGAGSKPFPRDAALTARFLAQRADFEKVVAMANEDKHLTRIATDFTWLDDDVAWPRKDIGISQDRWNVYKHEFRKVGATDGISHYANPTMIVFPIDSRGLAPTGAEKGLVYSQVPLKPLLKSLDGKPRADLLYGPDRTNLIEYKQIDEHWYLYYRQW